VVAGDTGDDTASVRRAFAWRSSPAFCEWVLRAAHPETHLSGLYGHVIEYSLFWDEVREESGWCCFGMSPSPPAVDRDFECCADGTHLGVGEPAEPTDQYGDRDTFDRVEVCHRTTRDGV
jgi:hypothetical protein